MDAMAVLVQAPLKWTELHTDMSPWPDFTACTKSLHFIWITWVNWTGKKLPKILVYMLEKNDIGSWHSILIPTDTCQLPGDTAFRESESIHSRRLNSLRWYWKEKLLWNLAGVKGGESKWSLASLCLDKQADLGTCYHSSSQVLFMC